MDMHEWESYALCSRLKSKRRKTRLQKNDLEKKLIGLHLELKKIRRKKNELGYRDLDPPVQRGWKRFFVLHSDRVTGDEAVFFQALLDKINTTEYSHRKDFKVKRKRKGKKVHVLRIQKMHDLDQHTYRKLKFTEKEKEYFEEVREPCRYTASRLIIKFAFTQPWRFLLRTEANIIRKERVVDPELEQQEAAIHKYLTDRKLYETMVHLTDGHYQYKWHRGEKAKYTYILNKRSSEKWSDEQYNETEKHEQY